MGDDYKRIAGSFLLGGVIGAIIALLYAPQSGRDTRKDITKKAKRVKREAVDLIDDTIDGIQDFADDMKDRASDIIERGVELSDSAKKALLKNLEHGQKSFEKQKKRITDALGR
jgi:gas vesicle protein